jgi:hypothetical protein
MVDANPQIPIVRTPVSMMDAGPNGHNLAVAAAQRHPVDAIQRRGVDMENPYSDLDFVRLMYGPGMAMEMAAERSIARREKLFVPKVGALYDDIVRGTDGSVAPADFLNLPENRSELPKDVLHPVMARHLPKTL